MTKKLSKQQIEQINELLKKKQALPEEYKSLLFESKKEYELVYGGKEREEDIIAETMAVPLQEIKTFGKDGNINSWANKLIFGDNLQVLKTFFEDPEIKGKIKLVYIDPPFGTGDVYSGRGGEPAYSAKLMDVKFIDSLRKRIIFLKELLGSDGNFLMRIDYHFGHYVKVILDEIFEKANFQNEILVNRGRNIAGARGRMEVDNDFILWYSRSSSFTFNEVKTARPISEIKWTSFLMAGERFPRERVFLSKKLIPPKGQHFALIQEKVDKLLREGFLRLKCRGCGALYYFGRSGVELHSRMKRKENRFKFYDITSDKTVHAAEKLEKCIECSADNFVVEYLGSDEKKISNIWLDIESYSKSTGYPTENSEPLLERIIRMASNEEDIVLDCYAGSGTTLAVAEKLNRQWIGIDASKLAIYTIQKRMLNLKAEIGNKGKDLTPKSFGLFNAGLYDYKLIKDLPWPEYRDFALKLFQCREEKHKISGIELDGYLGEDHVLVFQWHDGGEIILDRGYIDDLHKSIGKKVGRKFFIIAPASTVVFLEDYIEKDDVKYYILRIPYSIIEEIHEKGFSAIKQPVSEADVNNVVDAVGFDFIQIPDVECEYKIRKVSKSQKSLFEGDKEIVIKIKKFKSNILSHKPVEFKNLETLSMVMIDYDFNGEVFDIDDYWFADQITKDSHEVIFDPRKAGKQMMIIYMDIFGNEKREIKKLSDFK